MNSRDTGARADAASPVRPTVRELFLGRQFRVHRLVLLTLVVAVILVIAYVIKVSGSAGLEGLPGVTRVDREQHQVVLSSTITAAQAREVFDHSQQLAESWTLILGPARLATGADPGAASTDSHDAVDLWHRLGTAGLTEPAVITVDAYAPRIDAEPSRPSQAIPFARALVAELSADDGAAVDRLAVQGDRTVTIMRAALRRPSEADAVLALLDRVPGLTQAVLGEQTKAQVGVSDETAAEPACQAARKVLGGRTDIVLTVEIRPDVDAEGESRRC
jgi:hypothetical protein